MAERAPLGRRIEAADGPGPGAFHEPLFAVTRLAGHSDLPVTGKSRAVEQAAVGMASQAAGHRLRLCVTVTASAHRRNPVTLGAFCGVAALATDLCSLMHLVRGEDHREERLLAKARMAFLALFYGKFGDRCNRGLQRGLRPSRVSCERTGESVLPSFSGTDEDVVRCLHHVTSSGGHPRSTGCKPRTEILGCSRIGQGKSEERQRSHEEQTQQCDEGIYYCELSLAHGITNPPVWCVSCLW